MTAFRPEALTWAGLLGQWVQFAQVSLALPEHEDGPRWRQCVPAVINLQAVTFALADLEQLDADERALALDKADILIRENSQRLDQAWHEALMPESLIEIARDARLALAAAIKAKSE